MDALLPVKFVDTQLLALEASNERNISLVLCSGLINIAIYN